MSDTYTKLFSSITESTVWGEPYATRIVWVTLLAMADARGCVYGSIPGIARRANVTLPEVEAALASFQSPDPYSRTTEHDGRRIEPIDGGWVLVNHAKYAAIRGEAERREYKRQWDRANRSKQSDTNPTISDRSDSSPTESDKSDASPTNPTDPTPLTPTPSPTPEKQKQERASPSGSRLPEDWIPSSANVAYAQQRAPGIDIAREAERFRNYWISQPGAKGRKTDWDATWRNWCLKAEETKHGAAHARHHSSTGRSAAERVMHNAQRAFAAQADFIGADLDAVVAHG